MPFKFMPSMYSSTRYLPGMSGGVKVWDTSLPPALVKFRLCVGSAPFCSDTKCHEILIGPFTTIVAVTVDGWIGPMQPGTLMVLGEIETETSVTVTATSEVAEGTAVGGAATTCTPLKLPVTVTTLVDTQHRLPASDGFFTFSQAPSEVWATISADCPGCNIAETDQPRPGPERQFTG